MDFTTNIASDLHLNPEDEIEGPARELIEQSKYTPLIFAGDTLNALRNRKEAFRETIRRMSEIAGPNGNVMLLKGNHDLLDDLKWLVENYSCNQSLTVGSYMEIPIGNTYLYITHGHQWCPQWGWGLDLIAQPLLNFIMDLSPALWEWIAKRNDWSGPPTNEDRYHAVVLSIIAHGLMYAKKHDCRVYAAHSHKLSGVVDIFPESDRAGTDDYPIDYRFVSSAPLPTGWYVQVKDKIELKKIPPSDPKSVLVNFGTIMPGTISNKEISND